MELQQVDIMGWKDEFEKFCERYRRYFGRMEVQQQAQSYLRTLMAPVELKNGWTVAEAQNQHDPQPTQRLLRTATLQEHSAMAQLQAHVREQFATPQGILIVDESGVVKDGNCSAGVARQYCGRVGKVENCQVGVYLTYASEHGHAFLESRLYLPEHWVHDVQRRRKAHVPEGLVFQTKPQLALELLLPVLDSDFPHEWITGDSVYGNSPEFRETLKRRQEKFVLGVSSELPMWVRPPWLCGVPRKSGELDFEVCEKGPHKRTAAQVGMAMKAHKWKRLKVFEGSKGPRLYDWAAKRVYVSQEEFVGSCLWLLIRRSVSDPTKCDYYLCHAPVNVALLTLARVAASRWQVEQCFEEAKGETGMDQYQTRTWQGWHRHMLLSMLAHLFLALLKKTYNRNDDENGLLTVPEIRRLLELALPLPERTPESIWRWSLWRRRHNKKAKLSHQRRRTHSLAA